MCYIIWFLIINRRFIHMKAYIISVFNNKGGVGKTTTVTNLGHALARRGKKVLVVDIDSQCNTTTRILKREPKYTIYDMLNNGREIPPMECIHFADFQKDLFCLPCTPDLVELEPKLIARGSSGFSSLKDILIPEISEHFNFILIDCPPNHGIFVINSLFASHFAIVPTESGSKDSIRGLQKAISFIDDIKNGGNPNLRFLRLLLTKVDKRTSVSQAIMAQLQNHFGDQMFKTVIPQNVDFQKSEMNDETIFKYNLKASGSKAYRDLSRELISILQ